MKNNFYGVINEILGFICYSKKNYHDQYINEIHVPPEHHALFGTGCDNDFLWG